MQIADCRRFSGSVLLFAGRLLHSLPGSLYRTLGTITSGEALPAFCTRPNFVNVMPPVSNVKRGEFCGCRATTGCITNWLYGKTNK